MKNKKSAASSMILGVAFVWFTTHFGGGFAMISVSINACMTGRTKKFGFRNVPSSLYMIDTDVHAEQLDAIVGKLNTGLSSVIHRHFTVSSALPPPTPNTISAF